MSWKFNADRTVAFAIGGNGDAAVSQGRVGWTWHLRLGHTLWEGTAPQDYLIEEVTLEIDRLLMRNLPG